MDTEKKTASRFPRWLRLVSGGVACGALTGAAVWFDLTYNEGKLVYPMHSYAFRPTDIPMLAAVLLDVLYALYLAFLLVLDLWSHGGPDGVYILRLLRIFRLLLRGEDVQHPHGRAV